MDRNTRSSYYFSQATPDQSERMKAIAKTMLMDLYVGLYRESHPEADIEAVVADAEKRVLRLGKLGIR